MFRSLFDGSVSAAQISHRQMWNGSDYEWSMTQNSQHILRFPDKIRSEELWSTESVITTTPPCLVENCFR